VSLSFSLQAERKRPTLFSFPLNGRSPTIRPVPRARSQVKKFSLPFFFPLRPSPPFFFFDLIAWTPKPQTNPLPPLHRLQDHKRRGGTFFFFPPPPLPPPKTPPGFLQGADRGPDEVHFSWPLPWARGNSPPPPLSLIPPPFKTQKRTKRFRPFLFFRCQSPKMWASGSEFLPPSVAYPKEELSRYGLNPPFGWVCKMGS